MDNNDVTKESIVDIVKKSKVINNIPVLLLVIIPKMRNLKT